MRPSPPSRALATRTLLPLLPFVLLGSAAAEGPEGAQRPAYPQTRREDVKDLLHGVEVPDPYRWLEDDDAPEVEAWDRAQAGLLRQRLDAVAGRAALEARLVQELDQGGIESLPTFAGPHAFHTYRAPGDDHAALYVRVVGSDEPPRVVLDPNGWSRDGTQGLKSWHPSPDGRYVAYERDLKGSEATRLHVHDVQTGATLPDVITRTKFTSVAWRADSRAFYYTRLPDPDDVPAGEGEYHRRVRLHVLGTLVADDPLIYGQGRPKIEHVGLGTSTDERHRFLFRGIPYETDEVFEIDETWGTPRLEPIVAGPRLQLYGLDRVGERYVLLSDWGAPRRRLCVAERGATADPAAWTVIVPESESVLERFAVCRDRVAVLRRDDIVARLSVVGLDGADLGRVALPGAGTVRSLASKADDPRLWFTFEAYDVPPSTWVVDLSAPAGGAGPATRYEPTRLAQLPTTLRTDELVTERFSLPSKDGTPIPCFLLRRRSTPLDGTAPTVLYGYGGFRVGQYPSFSRFWGLWAEQGGVYVVACLRGGDELGEAWHEAGCLGRKQNVFDDFIGCADGLVATGRARRERLAIMGGSNGGLLVAAVANQRPDLCRAVVCSVPLTDMLRFHRFQYALTWTKEYGNPDVAEHFGWIRPYSPYHNVREGASYPAALVTAGLADGRVNAFHARKLVAQWQRASASARPVLLDLDRESGHGAASMRQAKRAALDRMCFLLAELGAAPAR